MAKSLMVLILLFCLSCSPMRHFTEASLYLEMEKTSCMGDCPVYTLGIYSDGHLFLDAREHLPLEGYYKTQLKGAKWENLQKRIKDTDLGSMKSEYISNYSDLPTTYIRYREQGKTRSIKDYDGAPEALDLLEDYLHNMIKELPWKEFKKPARQ